MPLDLAEMTLRLSYQKVMYDMNRKKVYIQAAEQISIQQPLSEQWFHDPIFYHADFVQAVNPSFREYIAANEARRMGNLIKRALVTSLKVLHKTGIEHPDAIITGTCIGCMNCTEKFLQALTENGEQTLSPTHFMQSTHNTVGSTLGIYTKTHSYNTTYSHGEISFDLTILDAWMQIQLGKISTALIGGHDEMIESYFKLLQKTGYVGIEGMDPCSEVAVSMMINTQAHEEDLCEIAGIRICNHPTVDSFKESIDALLHETGLHRDQLCAIMTGKNGNPTNDIQYQEIVDSIFPQIPLLHYKHIFGENYTASALGTYTAAHCLKEGCVPSFLYDTDRKQQCASLQNILLIHQTKGQEFSLILLKKI